MLLRQEQRQGLAALSWHLGARRYGRFAFHTWFITLVSIAVKRAVCKQERALIITNMLGKTFKTHLVCVCIPAQQGRSLTEKSTQARQKQEGCFKEKRRNPFRNFFFVAFSV